MADYFSTSYAQARERFLAAARAQGATLSSDPHPRAGRDGEALALDIAVLGDPHARDRLLISSGCHGVEGYCGSGVQLAVLSDAALLRAATQAGVTLVLAHALNPYGFSHIRRVTHENVDLNRNFVSDFAAAGLVGADYAAMHAVLVPDSWPPSPDNQRALQGLLQTHGLKGMQQIVSAGQYCVPQGLFYGGIEPTWSQAAVRRLLGQHLRSAHAMGWIDLHTGLGPSGHGERIASMSHAKPGHVDRDIERANRWWSGGGATPLTFAEDGSSVSAQLNGTMVAAVAQECPDTITTRMTIEYGTVPVLQVLQALRAEQWLTNHPDTDATTHQAIKQQLFEAFFTDTPEWKAAVLSQGLQAVAQGIRGLADDAATRH